MDQLKVLGERIYPEKPIVRKRRKQLGGKPTHRTYDLNVAKSKGYAMRSMKRKLPKIEKLSIKDEKERVKRSISHIHLKAELTKFETQQSRLEIDLQDTYKEFAYYLLKLEQEKDGSTNKDGWDTGIPAGVFGDFIYDTYEPRLIAFARLESKIKAFLAIDWEMCEVNVTRTRKPAYNYNLSKEQVGKLTDADKPYLRELM